MARNEADMNKILMPGAALEVSPLGLGTVQFGANLSPQEAERQMDAFLDAGGNLIDTAHVYNDWIPGPRGRSEIVIGDYIKKRGNRSRIVLSTKGAHPRLESMHTPRCTPEDIESDLIHSLRNLQIETIDLYFLHRDDPAVPVADIAGCLEDQVKKGRIRYYGCSNWTLKRMKDMAHHARQHGAAGFACNQALWSLADINMPAVADTTLVPMDKEMWAYHQGSGLAAMAYTSTAGGYFAKRAAGKDIAPAQQRMYGNASNERIYENLQSLSQQHHIPVLLLTLLYFAAQPFAAIPLTAFSSQQQLEEALPYLTGQYPADVVSALGALKQFVYG